jgi:membrane protein DedA with SNARE-associated domain
LSAYFLGKTFQKEINNLIKKYTFLKNEEEKVAIKFKKYGSISIFSTRFIHGAASILNYYSGIKKLKFKKFIIPVILGEIIYTSIYVFIGVFAKDTWQIIIRVIREFSTLILLTLVIYYFFPKIRNKLKS